MDPWALPLWTLISMGSRGLTLLRLATMDRSDREDGWRQLVEERNERVTRAMLRDYARRGFVTSEDPTSMQLTPAGQIRMNAGQAIADAREAS